MEKTVCELFAGVGGFRVGLEKANKNWKTVWFSQWEPGAKTQFAHDCYVRHFGDLKTIDGKSETGIDISLVDKKQIPEHNLLVGGFPCQDYSVAHSKASSKGIEGKKGVLWWQIYEILKAKKPSFCLFENVDRLIKSPAKQRGRDFGIMLACFNEQGYDVEWRIVNASDYGAGQKRKRTFIFAYRRKTNYNASLKKYDSLQIVNCKGFFAKVFPIEKIENLDSSIIPEDIIEVSDHFKYDFKESGYMREGDVYTAKSTPKLEQFTMLGDLLEKDVDEKYFLNDDKLNKFKYLKGSKHIPRKDRNGFEYMYSEGAIACPDYLDKPARTMLTSEGTINRCSHLIQDPQNNRFRIITPMEAERIQGFPDNWTEGMTERMRYFCMGNALVVPLITKMGMQLNTIFKNEH